MSSLDEKHEVEGKGSQSGADIFHNEVLASSDLMNDAFEGENAEHSEGIWTAFKSHPWACFWAFVMCFTIVSFSTTVDRQILCCFWHGTAADTILPVRSWNRSTCS